MSLEQTACEDLKAFERRLTEVIACLQPSTLRWRIILIIISTCTAIGAWYWLTDPHTSEVSFAQSLLNHPLFTTSCIILGRRSPTADPVDHIPLRGVFSPDEGL